MEIKDYRNIINDIDSQIVELLEKRMDAAAGIGLEKKKQGLPVFDSVREQERIDTVKALAGNENYKEHIGQIYRHIMEETKKMEQRILDEE